ncbi:MAG: hypothetical protein M1817_005944 [Caeruleum heppii]|nr:MAG: hypothetical protein M1817_005944 [Caeruleum heppii]
MEPPQDLPKATINVLRPPSISEIVPGLFVGNERSTHDERTLYLNRINAVVSLVNAPTSLWSRKKFTDYVASGRHLWIECLDSLTQDLLVHMTRVYDFIDRMLLPVQRSPPVYQPSQPHPSELHPSDQITTPESRQAGVLVHCEMGISRSGMMVVAYLMRKQRRGRDEVLADVRAKRARVKPNSNFMDQLDIWEKTGYQIWEDEHRKIPKEPYRHYLERRAAILKELGLTGDEPCRPMNLDADDPWERVEAILNQHKKASRQ